MKKYNSGQTLLIILLVMAVVLTIGLSVISRSITNIRISQEQEESARVFSAAEAGIEEALKQNLAVGNSLTDEVGGISYQVSAVAQGGGTTFIFPHPEGFKAGDTQTLWLVGHDEDTDELDPSTVYSGLTVEVYWGNEGQGADTETTPALEATLIYKDTDDEFKTFKETYDPNGGRAAASNFGSAEVGSYPLSVDEETYNFSFKGTIDIRETPYALRLKLLYNSDERQKIGVSGAGTFPLQGKCYESNATATETGITRKVRQCQFYKSLPAIFDYVLFSESSL